jgi:hypothetical protein
MNPPRYNEYILIKKDWSRILESTYNEKLLDDFDNPAVLGDTDKIPVYSLAQRWGGR